MPAVPGGAAGAAGGWAAMKLQACKVPGRNRFSRENLLKAVFHEFDWSNSGHITAHDIQVLGEARRAANTEKQGAWTPEKNQKMMAKIDANKDGVIDEKVSVHRTLSQSTPLLCLLYIQSHTESYTQSYAGISYVKSAPSQ